MLLPAETYHRAGPYFTYSEAWSKWAVLIGPHAEMTRVSERFPAGTELLWSYADAPVQTGVYGYNYLGFGRYWSVDPETPVKPQNIADIKALTVDHAVRYGEGRPAHYNVLLNSFLTAEAGRIDTAQVELGFMLHMPRETQDWFLRGAEIGDYTDPDGLAWMVKRLTGGTAAPYIVAMPKDRNPRLTGKRDVKHFADWLVKRGVVRPEWWFNGLALGCEPLRNAASAYVDRFTVTYR